ncbi:polyamine-modulated factor 1 [Procambarus clarkii]|uniref:polyamine-modulated factor 1 n=1 Tax=Procambarus clarkii TaxID=6728 RepID=UPI001E6733E9|nr:uncharacterized protein LOC123746570 [Procambarus clarkii]
MSEERLETLDVGARLGLQVEPMVEGTKLGLRVEPGEGLRLRALKESLNHIVERLLGGWKPSLFAKCFPTLAKENEAVLEALRASVVAAVHTALFEDLIAIIEEDVAKPLEELSLLVKNHSGPKNVKAWRPSGDPLLDMRAHDAKVLKYEKQRLVETVEASKMTTEGLLQKVESGRKQCHDNQLEIQSRLSPLNELYALSSELPQETMIACFHNIIDRMQ